MDHKKNATTRLHGSKKTWKQVSLFRSCMLCVQGSALQKMWKQPWESICAAHYFYGGFTRNRLAFYRFLNRP